MYERAHRSDRPAERAYEQHATPGRSTRIDDASAPPLFAGDETWEDIDPSELVATPPAAKAAPMHHYADSHRKTVRDYRIGTRRLRVTDLANRARGYVNERDGETQFADQQISVDIGTVVGSKRDGYRNAYVLVWHTRKGGDDRVDPATGMPLNPKRRSADPTGWIKVGKLPNQARADIAAFQDRERAALRRGSGPGHHAPKLGQTMTVAPINPESITEKYIDRPPHPSKLEAFRIKGGGVDPETGIPSSTPAGNYTKTARYGENIVGVWNPPGSTGSNGKANTGSGGIRVFVPIGTQLELCAVPPIEIPNFDTDVGMGTSTWIYVTARIAGEPLYFWILQKWTFTTGDGKDRSGANG